MVDFLNKHYALAHELGKRDSTVTLEVNELSWHTFRLCCCHAEISREEQIKALSKAFFKAGLDVMMESHGANPSALEDFEEQRGVSLVRMIKKELGEPDLGPPLIPPIDNKL